MIRAFGFFLFGLLSYEPVLKEIFVSQKLQVLVVKFLSDQWSPSSNNVSKLTKKRYMKLIVPSKILLIHGM